MLLCPKKPRNINNIINIDGIDNIRIFTLCGSGKNIRIAAGRTHK